MVDKTKLGVLGRVTEQLTVALGPFPVELVRVIADYGIEYEHEWDPASIMNRWDPRIARVDDYDDGDPPAPREVRTVFTANRTPAGHLLCLGRRTFAESVLHVGFELVQYTADDETRISFGLWRPAPSKWSTPRGISFVPHGGGYETYDVGRWPVPNMRSDMPSWTRKTIPAKLQEGHVIGMSCEPGPNNGPSAIRFWLNGQELVRPSEKDPQLDWVGIPDLSACLPFVSFFSATRSINAICRIRHGWKPPADSPPPPTEKRMTVADFHRMLNE